MNTTLPPLDEVFPFVYAGGGYFRQKGVKKGQPAPILHGREAVEFLYNQLLIRMDPNVESVALPTFSIKAEEVSQEELQQFLR